MNISLQVNLQNPELTNIHPGRSFLLHPWISRSRTAMMHLPGRMGTLSHVRHTLCVFPGGPNLL